MEYRRIRIQGRAVVVSFDMCSSSDIIEALTLCDGWILLFPEPIDGKALFKFLQDLCNFFEKEFRRRVLRHISTPPALVGLTFGLEMGLLVPMTMYGQQEYIGWAINVACRLQGAIKDRDKSPAYKALVSNSVYRKYLEFTPKKVKVFSVPRNLRNIRGGKSFHCKKVELLNAQAT